MANTKAKAHGSVASWPARWTVLIGSAVAMINYLVMAYIDVFSPELLDSEADPDVASH